MQPLLNFSVVSIGTPLKRSDLKPMRRKLIPIVTGLSGMALLSGCVFAIGLGDGKKDSNTTTNNSNSSHVATSNPSNPTVVQQTVAPTIGQQLLDLKKAHDTGAISDSEYQTEKAKILAEKQ
jgi:hypothetical protein